MAAFLAAQHGAVPPSFEGDGRQTRDFVFIDDVVDALVRAGERGSGLVINIGTGVQTTLRDLWREIGGGAGACADRRPGASGRSPAVRRLARAGADPSRLVAVDLTRRRAGQDPSVIRH